MKGLLHRLAARAAGTTIPVRSDARLPFGGTSLGWGEAIAIEATPGTVVTASARHPSPAREAARPSAHPDGSGYDAPAPVLDRSSTPSSQPTPRTDLLPRVPQDLRADGPSASPPAPAGQLQLKLPLPIVEGGSADARQTPPVNAEPYDVPAERPPATEVPPLSPWPDAPNRSNYEPPLLMPRATERALTPARVASAAAREPVRTNVGAPSAADDPTEVHIHIGRIEVTALHEAPVPRSRPSRQHAPMSLDAYLAARRKT